MKTTFGLVIELAKELSSLESQLEAIQTAITTKKAELIKLLGPNERTAFAPSTIPPITIPPTRKRTAPTTEGKRKRLWEINDRVLEALDSGPKTMPELLDAAGLTRTGGSYKRMARTIRSLTAKNKIAKIEKHATRVDGQRYSRAAWIRCGGHSDPAIFTKEPSKGLVKAAKAQKTSSDAKESKRIAILEALFNPKRPLTIKEVRQKVGGGTELIHNLVAEMIRDELIEKQPYTLPNSRRAGHGWVTTPKGAAVIEQATSPFHESTSN